MERMVVVFSPGNKIEYMYCGTKIRQYFQMAKGWCLKQQILHPGSAGNIPDHAVENQHMERQH